jgi:predicted amidohydrolase
MATWKIAGVQMDCRLGDKIHNLKVIRDRLRQAAGQGARLVVFPECALTGYCFETSEEAAAHAEILEGPSAAAVAADCARLGVWAAFGFLEKAKAEFFNSVALVGPHGVVASYRKVHMPCLGVDRFATPGNRPFAVHDLGGLRLGINICYDGSFPESSRVLTILGADLIVLPTNWPTGAASTAKYLVPARALENHVYYMAVNRVGEERGFRFIGQSQIADCDGELLACSQTDEAIIYGEIDPEHARRKQIVKIPGKYEINRVAHRRPEMYGPLCQLPAAPGGIQ